jgi:hypothetical protein
MKSFRFSLRLSHKCAPTVQIDIIISYDAGVNRREDEIGDRARYPLSILSFPARKAVYYLGLALSAQTLNDLKKYFD